MDQHRFDADSDPDPPFFYVTEEPSLHLTVSCQFLICCVTQVFWPVGGKGGNWVVKLLYDPVFRVLK